MRARAFILHMSIPNDKKFLWVVTFVTLWPWPRRLTYFGENFKFVDYFWKVRPFIWHISIPSGKISSWILTFYKASLTWAFGLLFEISNFVDNFWTVSDRVLIFLMSIACSKTFPCVNILALWPLLWSLAYFEVFNPVNSFKIGSARALTFHMEISCDKTYALSPWPWMLACIL